MRSYERVRDEPREIEFVDRTIDSATETDDTTLPESSAPSLLPVYSTALTEEMNTNSSEIESKTSREVSDGSQHQDEPFVIASV